MEVSSDIVSKREKYIKLMTEFIEEKKEKLNGMLKRLGLSTDELLKGEDKQICPYNKDHIVPQKSYSKHVESCKLLSAGYQKDELPALLQDVDFCYKNAESVMKIEIDENLLNKIIWDHCVQNGQVYTGHRTMPVSYIDENIMLSQEDRLAVYYHVVKKSHEAGKVIPVDRNDDLLTTDWSSLVKKGLLDEQNNKQFSSKLEQLAALRDLKRRRQSYRAKNVHITKKSYTEIIREVISNQMEILVPGSSSDVTASTSHEEVADSSSDRRGQSRQKSKERDRRDYSPREGENKKREHKGDSTRRRSRGRDKRASAERSRHRDLSEDRFSNWSGRDTKHSRDRDHARERSRIGDDDNSQSSSKDKPRRFTEADDLLLKEIKKESLINDIESNFTSTSADGVGYESTKEELKLPDDLNISKSSMSQKRSRSDSDSSSSKKYGKHKKSKHKKKHSKKHKRKD